MFTLTDINPSSPISVVNSSLLEIRKAGEKGFLMSGLQFANLEYSPLLQHVAVVIGC